MTSEVRGRPCLLVGWCRLGDRFGVIENPVGLPVPQLRRKASTFFSSHLPRQSHRTKGFAFDGDFLPKIPTRSLLNGIRSPHGPIASSLTTRTSLNKRTDQGLSCVLRTTHELAPEGDLLTIFNTWSPCWTHVRIWPATSWRGRGHLISGRIDSGH